MIGFDWIGLRGIEEAWAAAGSPLGTHRYDSLGRPLPPLYGYLGQQASRAQRVYDALQQSGPVAQSLLAQRLRSISLAAVWDVLEHLVKEIALLYGGAAVGGGVIGAVLGAFAGGVGAIPGAVAGGGIGVGAATVYLEWMGLFCLARGLASAFSAAAACYLDGMREAWGPPPDTGSFHQEPGAPTGNVGLAAQRIAEGHVQLLIALLSGIAMYLMRGGAERLKVLSEIRASKKLGPRVERWVVENEKALVDDLGSRKAASEPGVHAPQPGSVSTKHPVGNAGGARASEVSEVGNYAGSVRWGIRDVKVREAPPGYWGQRFPQSDPAVNAYELQINPNNESYYLPHPKGGYVQFENLVRDTLQDGKLVTAPSSIYYVADKPAFLNQSILNEATRQVEAATAADLQVEWLVSNERAAAQLQNLLQSQAKPIPITVTYLPVVGK